MSDEFLIEQWKENAYYQYFCGMQKFIRLFYAPLLNWFISANVSVKMKLNLSFRKAFV